MCGGSRPSCSRLGRHDGDGGSLMSLTQRVLWPLLATAAVLAAQGNPDWHKSVPAFKVAGELYYVGTADLAVYLVHTPQGNILIKSDFEQDLPLIKASIESLGFNYYDT